MAHPIQRYAFLAQFTCLGAECPDTCCRCWDMQVDDAQLVRYREKAPELLASVDTDARIMKRDAASDVCVQLTDGLCGIQSKYGSAFVGDACHFYPRRIRNIGGTPLMGAALSCPEVARLVLESDTPFAIEDAALERLPTTLSQPGHRTDAPAVMAKCMQAVETAAPEQAMAQLVHAAYGLEAITPGDWPTALPALLAEPTPAPETKSSDAQALLYALALLIAFGPNTQRPRLMQTIASMEAQLDCRILWETRGLTTGAHATTALSGLQQRWPEAAMAPVLRRWLQAQLMMTAFPLGGFIGTSLSERGTILAVRFATVKLALMCHVAADGTPPDSETTIRIIQSISRLMDHLADAELSLMIYRDAGWLSEARLAGLTL